MGIRFRVRKRLRQFLPFQRMEVIKQYQIFYASLDESNDQERIFLVLNSCKRGIVELLYFLSGNSDCVVFKLAA